jgi:hypothetical protein
MSLEFSMFFCFPNAGSLVVNIILHEQRLLSVRQATSGGCLLLI